MIGKVNVALTGSLQALCMIEIMSVSPKIDAEFGIGNYERPTYRCFYTRGSVGVAPTAVSEGPVGRPAIMYILN